MARPVMELLDLLGRRWALRVIWELRQDEGLTFRALRLPMEPDTAALEDLKRGAQGVASG